MAEELDEFGIPIKKKSGDVDEFGIPVKKKALSKPSNAGSVTDGGISVSGSNSPLGFAQQANDQLSQQQVPFDISDPKKREGYDEWKASLPKRLQYDKDYDLRGYYNKFGPSKIKGDEHLTDEFKLPNHPTFSTESKYFNENNRMKAGEWQGDMFIPFDTKKMAFDEKNNRLVKNPRSEDGFNANRLIDNTTDFNLARESNPELYDEQLLKLDQKSNRLSELNQIYDQSQGQGSVQNIQDAKATQEASVPTATESMGNSLSNFANRLKGTIPRLQVVSADAWEKVLGKELAKKAYEFEGRDINQVRDEAYAELDALAHEIKPTLGIVDAIQDGNTKNFMAGVVNTITSLGSTAVPALATGGAGLFTEMTGDALVDFNEAKAKRLGKSVSQLYKDEEAEFEIPAMIGAVGGALELIGLKGVKNIISNNVKGNFYKKALIYFGESQKEGLTELLQGGMEAANKALGAGGTPEDADKAFYKAISSKEGLESYLQGVIGSGAAGGLGRIATTVTSPQAKSNLNAELQSVNLLEMELQRPDISDQARATIENQLIQSASTIADIVEQDEKIDSKLRPEQRKEATRINEQISDLDAVIEDPNVSPEVKEQMESLREPLEKELEEVYTPKEPVQETISVEPDHVSNEVKETPVEPIIGVNEIYDANDKIKKVGDKTEYDSYVKKVFPKSKVDVVMYHDTNADFDLKDYDRKRTMYFTSAKAGHFSDQGKTISAIVNLENPKYVDAHEITGKTSKELIKEYEDQGYDGLIATPEIYEQRLREDGRDPKDHVNDLKFPEVLVFNPDQIHELGSESDIKAFKEYKNKANENNQTAQEVVTEDIPEKRNEEVLTKANTDLETLKQVKNKVAKYTASVKRLNEARKAGEISEQEFNDTKARFDDVMADSNNVPKAERLTPEETTTLNNELSNQELTTDDFIEYERSRAIPSVDIDAEAVQQPESNAGRSGKENEGSETAQGKASEKVTEIQERRQSIKDRISQKLKEQRGNISSGFDPSLLSDFIELGSTYVEEGIVKASDFIKRFREEYKELGFDDTQITDEEITSEVYDKIDNGLKETSLKNADVSQKRKDYGLSQRELPTRKSNEVLFEEADKAIEDGYDIQSLMDQIIFEKKVTSDVEQVILLRYQALKEAELIRANRTVERAVMEGNDTVLKEAQLNRDTVLDDLQKAYQASETSGTEIARALRSRQLKVMQDYSLANMFIQKRKSNGGAKLTEEQIQEVQSRYDKISKLNAELEERLSELEEKYKRVEAQKALDKIRRDNKKANRASTREQILENRKKAIASIFEIAKKQRSNLSANPITAEYLKPIAELAKSYVQDGILSLQEIVDKIHEEISPAFEDLTKRDVRDALSGYGRENELTRDEIATLLDDLRQQAKLVSQIEDKEAGLARIKKNTERHNTASQELEGLREQFREMNYEDDSLAQFKKRLKDKIKELNKRIEDKDFTPRAEAREYPLDEEALQLRDELNKAKFDFEVELLRDEMARRNKFEKGVDLAKDILAVPRSLMSSVDLSAPFRQGLVLTISNPTVASRAFYEMFTQAVSQSKHERWLNDLKASPAFDLMKDSGLYIADDRNPRLTAREEVFSSNLAERIPLIGKTLRFKVGDKNVKIPGANLIGGSQRAYVAYLNKLRADVFLQGADQFHKEGYTFESHPELFKALGEYINSATGRGDLGAFEGASSLLSATFFSPRLMASRIRLLTNPINVVWWKNTPAKVRNMYFGDMAKTIAFISSLLALAVAFGDDDQTVSLDPLSPDFGKLRVGDVRYDVWGGMQQYVRLAASLYNYGAQKALPKSWWVSNKKTKRSGLDILVQFTRSKLAPVPGFATNALAGKNVVGRPFDMSVDLPQLFVPLSAGDIAKDLYNGETEKFFTKGLPSLFGVGVAEYNRK